MSEYSKECAGVWLCAREDDRDVRSCRCLRERLGVMGKLQAVQMCVCNDWRLQKLPGRH